MSKIWKAVFVAVFCVVVSAVVFTGCSRNEEVFEYLQEKTFIRDDGAVLKFYEDNTASYEYTNLIGVRYFYLYDVKVGKEEKDGSIELVLENLDTDEREKAYVNMEKNEITYYSQVYRLK